MATIYVSFTDVMANGSVGPAPVFAPNPLASEKLVSGGTQTLSTIAAPRDCFATVFNSGDIPVWINFGLNPDASAEGDQCHFILAGASKDLGLLKADTRLAVIDDA